jgi:hypothetical protein
MVPVFPQQELFTPRNLFPHHRGELRSMEPEKGVRNQY